MDLTTSYLGFSLRSPLVPSASPLSEKIEDVREMEQAGAAAVVFHSLFEEQIEAVTPECRVDPATYLEHIAEAKRSVDIPIIASLNCTTLGGWLSYKRHLSGARRDQAGDGRRRRDHVVQRAHALRDHAYPTSRNGPRCLAGATSPQFLEPSQRHHEPAKLPRPQRIRARAIRAGPFQLHVAVSNATVSSRRVSFYRFRPSFVSATK